MNTATVLLVTSNGDIGYHWLQHALEAKGITVICCKTVEEALTQLHSADSPAMVFAEHRFGPTLQSVLHCHHTPLKIFGKSEQPEVGCEDLRLEIARLHEIVQMNSGPPPDCLGLRNRPTRHADKEKQRKFARHEDARRSSFLQRRKR